MKIKPLLHIICFFIFMMNEPGAFGQWIPVTENVLPVDIAISPEYNLDQTVYMLDSDTKLRISETGGSQWVNLYEAPNPQEPSNKLLDLVISPNFRNDNAIVRIHKDGTAKLSFDRGQYWIDFPVPDGTTGIVFSPNVAVNYKIFCVTGAFGPVEFYRSVNGGTTWGRVSEIAIGGGFYCRLWHSQDTAAMDFFAVQQDSKTLIISNDGGITWQESFQAEVPLQDFAISPEFSEDHTVFVSAGEDIWINTNGGAESDWVKAVSYDGSAGIRLAISPTFGQDHTLYAAVDQVGIVRSIDGGQNFTGFSDGFLSTLPISISISQVQPSVIFAGTQAPGGNPGRLFKYQTALGTGELTQSYPFLLRNHPNPFSGETEITFELKVKGHVEMAIFDLTGKKIVLLLDESMSPGMHRVGFNLSQWQLTPGVYLCKLESGNQIQTIKLVAGAFPG